MLMLETEQIRLDKLEGKLDVYTRSQTARQVNFLIINSFPLVMMWLQAEH